MSCIPLTLGGNIGETTSSSVEELSVGGTQLGEVSGNERILIARAGKVLFKLYGQ